MSILQRKLYYVGIGICIKNIKYCCVYVGTEPIINNVIYSHIRYKYALHTRYTFNGPRKSVYATIMTNLYECGIYPNGDKELYKPPINPNNKIYADLLATDLANIKYILRRSIGGLTMTKINGVFTSVVNEYNNTDEQINDVINREQPQITLDFTGSLMLTPVSHIVKCDFNKRNSIDITK